MMHEVDRGSLCCLMNWIWKPGPGAAIGIAADLSPAQPESTFVSISVGGLRSYINSAGLGTFDAFRTVIG
jgi:hypothetical protein